MKVLNYFDYNSYVTLTMFFISLFVLILGYITNGKSTNYLFSTQRASLLNPRTYIRLFTHILGHSNFKHFSNNYLMILLLGPLIEEKYGWLNYLIMILLTAFITGIVNFIKGNTNLKGSSNIVFMLIVLSAFVNVTESKIPLTLVLVVLFYVINEIRDMGKNDDIAHYGHVTGAICGLIFGFLSLKGNLIDIIINLFKI